MLPYAMHRVVIDTSVLVSALMSEGGASRQVLRLALQGNLQPIMGSALFNEYENLSSRREIIDRATSSLDELETLIDAFLSKCDWVVIWFLWRPSLRDKADIHLVDLAIAGNASFIMTYNVGDSRQAELVCDELRIVSPADYLKNRSVA